MKKEMKKIALGRENKADELSLKNLAALGRLLSICEKQIEQKKENGMNVVKFVPMTLPLIAASQYVDGKGELGSIGLDELRAVWYALNEKFSKKHKFSLKWELIDEEGAAEGRAFTYLVRVSRLGDEEAAVYDKGLTRDRCRESSAKRGKKDAAEKSEKSDGGEKTPQEKADGEKERLLKRDEAIMSIAGRIHDAAAAAFKGAKDEEFAKFEIRIMEILEDIIG